MGAGMNIEGAIRFLLRPGLLLRIVTLFACLWLIEAPCRRLAWGNPADAGEVVISAIENEQTHAIAKDVLTEAYGRIGYRVRFNDLPGKRALEWANQGLTDGDVGRIKETEKKFPNLLPVNVPIIHIKGVVFTKAVDRNITRWRDLEGLRIGVVRGIRYSAIGTQGMSPFQANDMTHLFAILDKDRIEVAVAVLDAGVIETGRNFRDSGIHVVGAPLFSAPLYHFVHEKNTALVAPLETALSDMTSSGRIEVIRAEAIDRLKRK